MTQTEEIATTVEAKTTSEQINERSMAANETRDPELSSSSGIHEEESQEEVAATGSVVEMGSTDSAGSTAGGPSSCGLVSSLFPSSCRGRAEAFARRLHHRLTSLGSDDDEGPKAGRREPTKPSETSWLHSSASVPARNHVLERQPRHSSDSDLYYDFDIDDDVPGSPAEEATDVELASLLINPEILKTNRHNGCRSSPNSCPAAAQQDPESGCVFSSPVTGTSPDSDSANAYFDPASSETDNKINSESFYDPVTTTSSSSGSDGSSLTNGSGPPTRHQQPIRMPGRMKTVDLRADESSESSELTRNCVDKKEPIERQTCSSEDSLNGRSSLDDTTSPSHESLWSTFDDSTLSLQDDVSPTKTGAIPTAIVMSNHVRKSHSDSEIPIDRCKIDDQLIRRDPVVEADEVDLANGVSERNMENLSRNLADVSLEPTPTGVNRWEANDKVRESVENLKDVVATNANFKSNDDGGTSDTDTDHSTYSSMINIPGALILECSTGTRMTPAKEMVKNEVKLVIENGTVLNGSEKGEEKSTELLKRLEGDSTPKEPEETKVNAIVNEERTAKQKPKKEEEEDDRPRRIRRCSSLKTGKTPPGTPGRKKIVRFADVLGLDLADVRTFLDEIPKIPNSAYSDLIYDDTLKDPPIHQTFRNNHYSETRPKSKLNRMLVPLFQQPGGLTSFLDIVRERQVCLENVLVQDPVSLCIQGTVRVRNLDFHKSVHIRYTLNGWQTFSDLQATYVANSCDGFSDKFTFVLYCHTLRIGQRLEFAVRFQCKGAQYWDNNAGANYSFQCLPTAPTVGYIPITSATEAAAQDWSSSTFY